MPFIKISEETFDRLCELRKSIQADYPHELVDYLANKWMENIDVVLDPDVEPPSVQRVQISQERNSQPLKHYTDDILTEGQANSEVLTLPTDEFLGPILSDPVKIDPKNQSPSNVNFVLFRTSFLTNVLPSKAYVQGNWFKIKFWNEAVFATIKALLDAGIAVEDIVNVLHPRLKIGCPEGYVPIKGQNLSHIQIDTPKVSWECIEKLSKHWDVDVRVRFRWTEKAKVEFRGLQYEISTQNDD